MKLIIAILVIFAIMEHSPFTAGCLSSTRPRSKAEIQADIKIVVSHCKYYYDCRYYFSLYTLFQKDTSLSGSRRLVAYLNLRKDNNHNGQGVRFANTYGDLAQGVRFANNYEDLALAVVFAGISEEQLQEQFPDLD